MDNLSHHVFTLHTLELIVYSKGNPQPGMLQPALRLTQKGWLKTIIGLDIARTSHSSTARLLPSSKVSYQIKTLLTGTTPAYHPLSINLRMVTSC